MRHFCLFAALSVAAAAVAQSPADRHEVEIWEAYQNFRTADTMMFEMTSVDAYGKTGETLHAFLYLRRSTDPRTGLGSFAQADLVVKRVTKAGEETTLRLVGDGVNLYRYDLQRREYSVTTYGFYGKRAPENYARDVRSDMPKLLAQLRAATPGLATYMVRLASEMNPSGAEFAARFNDWAPGLVVRADGVTPGPHGYFFKEVPAPLRQDKIVTDPITQEEFVEGADRYVFFNYNRPDPDRTVVFHLQNAAEDGSNEERWEVGSVHVGLLSPGRRVKLSIVPTAVATGLDTWVFRPYTGADASAFRLVTRGR